MKKMEKVYFLSLEIVVNGRFVSYINEAFKDKQGAKDKFDNFKKEIKRTAYYKKWVETMEQCDYCDWDDSDTLFAISDSANSYQMENYVYMEIKEYEVH